MSSNISAVRGWKVRFPSFPWNAIEHRLQTAEERQRVVGLEEGLEVGRVHRARDVERTADRREPVIAARDARRFAERGLDVVGEGGPLPCVRALGRVDQRAPELESPNISGADLRARDVEQRPHQRQARGHRPLPVQIFERCGRHREVAVHRPRFAR
jgi:hypothetical protein